MSKGKSYVLSLLRFLFCVIHEKPDIVHWHEIKIPFIEYHLLNCFKRRNIQVIYSAHDVLHFERAVVSKHLKRLYCSFNRIITHAEDSKQLIMQLFNVSSQKIDVIPMGEYSCISGEVQDKKTARKTLGILTDRKVVLFFGYIRKYKGLKILLEALSKIRTAIPDVFLIIAGEPKEEFSIYKKDIERLELGSIVLCDIRYIPMENISVYFSASDMVVLPYTHVYQSGLLYLAFAHRRPVIVTDVGGLPEIVEEGKSGFIIPPNNPTRLAQTMEKALLDISRLERMGQYAFQNAKERYSWNRIAEKTVRIYRDITTRQIVQVDE